MQAGEGATRFHGRGGIPLFARAVDPGKMLVSGAQFALGAGMLTVPDGSTTVVLDGQRLDGTLVPLQKAGTQNQVTVTVPLG